MKNNSLLFFGYQPNQGRRIKMRVSGRLGTRL